MSTAEVPAAELVEPAPRAVRPSLAAHARAFAWVVLLLGFVTALGRLLLSFGERLWAEEHYRFFPLLLAAAAWIGARRYRMAAGPGFVLGRADAACVGWGLSLAVAGAAVLLGSPFLAAVATFTALPVAAYQRGGWGLARLLLPACLLLLLILPPPFGWDREMVVGLQTKATTIASALLDLCGVSHVPDGVTIRLPEATFFVDAACSGVHSLFASLAFAGVLAIALGHGPVRTAILLGATVGWVIAANAVRVFSVVVLSSWYDLPVVDGAGHEALGTGIFVVTAGLILSTDRLLLFACPTRLGVVRRLVRRVFTRAAKIRSPHPRPTGNATDRSRQGVLAFAAVGYLALGFVRLSAVEPQAGSLAGRLPEGIKPVPADAMPEAWEGWRRTGFEVKRRTPLDPQGEWSRIWTYRKGSLAAAISIDGPYAEWHDLRFCYEGTGYQTTSYRHVRRDGSARLTFTELALRHPGGRFGYVCFAAYDFSDRPVAPPGPFSRRIASALGTGHGSLAGRSAGPIYQIQLFAEGRRPLTDADRRELADLHDAMSERLAAAGSASEASRGAASGGSPGGRG